MKYTYIVSGLKGTVLPIFQPVDEPITIEIEAKKISKATEQIKQYFTDNFLIAERIKLVSIRFI